MAMHVAVSILSPVSILREMDQQGTQTISFGREPDDAKDG